VAPGLGLVGVVSALVLLLRGPAPRTAIVTIGLTIAGNVLFTGLFAAAAFAQPAIGRAFLAGTTGAETSTTTCTAPRSS